MCLFTRQSEPFVGFSPIRCLKVVDVVGGEFIHSYGELTPAEMMTYSLGYRAIFKYVIPKGERYFVSSDGTQYASKSIRFVR